MATTRLRPSSMLAPYHIRCLFAITRSIRIVRTDILNLPYTQVDAAQENQLSGAFHAGSASS
jgi:hypothetical protein